MRIFNNTAFHLQSG